jgi:8-oxo-dGTP diphosphatase
MTDSGSDQPRLATVIVVDMRGWLLLQERDEHAPVAPNQWGMVGGHVDPGEEFESAAYRELAEETGLAWTSGLRLWRDAQYPYNGIDRLARYQVWIGRADLSDTDITVGEGRQIVFVHPDVVRTLDLSDSSTYFVHAFLDSPEYSELASW